MLALLMTTLQVPVNTHWCGGKVYNRGIYTQASPCAMNTPKVDDRGVSLSETPCCSNESTILAATGLDFDGQISTAQHKSPVVELSTVVYMADLALIDNDHSALNGFPQGPPTWSAPDLYDLYQSYLI